MTYDEIRQEFRLLPRQGHQLHGQGLVGEAVCERCAHPVATDAVPPMGVRVVRVFCWECVDRLTPRSTWRGHFAAGTVWLATALAHEKANDGTVLLAHGTLLCRYRPAGPGRWELLGPVEDPA